MTCNEFHLYFGISTHADVLTSSDELSEHVRTCADCRGFFNMQQEVGRHLRLVRDSVPQVSASLDVTVLANYRECVAERTSPRDLVSLRKRIAPLAFSWRGAVAAGVLTALILSFASTRSVNTIAPPRAVESATVPQSPNPRTTTAAIAQQTKPRMLNTPAHQARRTRAVVSLSGAGGALPAGFRSLMYCDQFSCAEAMEIIRVQLPTSIAALTPASTATNEIVFADVLVGPDGIARGIRIVE